MSQEVFVSARRRFEIVLVDGEIFAGIVSRIERLVSQNRRRRTVDELEKPDAIRMMRSRLLDHTTLILLDLHFVLR